MSDLTFEIDLASYEYYLSVYESEPWTLEKDPIVRQRLADEAYRRVYHYLLFLVDRAAIERQEEIKKQWPALPPVLHRKGGLAQAPEDEALAAVERTALNYRVDLMNVRGQLTDAWRKIRVAANALMGTFNVDYHLDASTPATGGNPFAFGGCAPVTS